MFADLDFFPAIVHSYRTLVAKRMEDIDSEMVTFIKEMYAVAIFHSSTQNLIISLLMPSPEWHVCLRADRISSRGSIAPASYQ